MAGALHEVLQEQVVGALLGLPQPELRVVELQPRLLADIVVQAAAIRCGVRRADAQPDGQVSSPCRWTLGPLVALKLQHGDGKAINRICAVPPCARGGADRGRTRSRRRRPTTSRSSACRRTRRNRARRPDHLRVDERRQRRGRREPVANDQQIMPQAAEQADQHISRMTARLCGVQTNGTITSARIAPTRLV